MAGQLFVQALQALLEDGALRRPGMESRACADVPDVADVVVETFHFEQQCPQPRRALGNHRAGQPLGRHGERDGVRHRAGAARALDGEERVVERLALNDLLDAAVRVEETRIEVEDRFADVGEAEMTRLDDAGVDRADRQLVHTFAVDFEVVETPLIVLGAARLRTRPFGAGDSRAGNARGGRVAADPGGWSE